jgi:hypothetical protein
MFNMKRLLLILVLTLSLQSWTKADDISEFEMEGLSVGDSLLDHFSRKEIETIKSNKQYPNDKFIIYEADNLIDIKQYDFFGLTTKKNDDQYIITSLSGSIFYENLDECYKIRDQISTYIENIIDFDDFELQSYKSQDGDGMVYGLQYYLKPYPSLEAIVLNCNQYSKDSTFKKDLSVSVNSEDYSFFLINEAYN